MHYIRIVRLIIFCLLLPLAVQAKREKVDMPDKPVVSDSILQCIFQFSPFYSRIIDEYKADLYIKGKVKVHKRNHLIRYVPSMFRFEKHINDYLMESLSELHYTAPDIYDRKIKAVSTTFPRNRGQITDVMDYLNMNIYSSSLMSDKLLSPLDKKSTASGIKYSLFPNSVVRNWSVDICGLVIRYGLFVNFILRAFMM